MSYHISNRVHSISPSPLLEFFDILATMDDVLSLGVGEPDFPTPPPVCRAGIASITQGNTGYTSNAGILELRQALARHLARRYGVSYAPETEIIITAGVSEALHTTMLAIVNPGDEVIVPEPCFVAYVPDVLLAGGVPVRVPTYAKDEFQLTPEQVEAALTPRTVAILLSYPNNPTGAVMSRERLLQIAQLAEKHDLIVISDEIYDRFVYGVEHICFPSLPNMRERTVLLGGFSKAYAMTGWRIGYAAGPREIIENLFKIHQHLIMSAPTMGQIAALEALERGEECVEKMVAEFGLRRDVVVEGLKDIGLPCVTPRGAFYAFPSVETTGLSCLEFSKRLLLEEKVAVVPGNAFGSCGEGHVRIAYTLPISSLEEALHRIDRFVRRIGRG